MIKKCVGNFWGLLLSGLILLSIIGCAASRTILGNIAIGYYINYLCWFTLCIVFFLKERKIKFSKEYIIIFTVIIFNAIIGAFFGKIYLHLDFTNLHQGILTGLAIVIVMGIEWKDYLKEYGIILIMKFVFWIGIAISLYAIIIQNRYLIGVLRGIDRSISAWLYTSIFGQRNIYAYFCFLSSVAGKYLFDITRKKGYIFGLILFALQIYVTDSRNAILSLVLFYIMCAFLRYGKRGRVIFIFSIIVIGIGSIFFMDINTLLGRLYHGTKSPYGDSGVLRLAMWYSCIKYLITNNAILTGFGYGAQTQYLMPLFDLGSAHNAYMDILFQGGIVLLGIYIYMVVKVFKAILVVGNPIYMYTSLSFVLVYLVNNLFDSFSMLFSSNFAGIPTTIMICILTKIGVENRKVEIAGKKNI